MLTDLDQFAKAVITGICASGPTPEWTNPRLAAEAYDMAEAMMQERMLRQPQLGALRRDMEQP